MPGWIMFPMNENSKCRSFFASKWSIEHKRVYSSRCFATIRRTSKSYLKHNTLYNVLPGTHHSKSLSKSVFISINVQYIFEPK